MSEKRSALGLVRNDSRNIKGIISTRKRGVSYNDSSIDSIFLWAFETQPGTYSFTIPPGVSNMLTIMVGAGGSGGVATAATGGAGNTAATGGGGGAFIAAMHNVVPGQTFTYTVGTGGTASGSGSSNTNANGVSGTDTTLNTDWLIAGGGSKGLRGNTTVSGGAGGIAIVNCNCVVLGAHNGGRGGDVSATGLNFTNNATGGGGAGCLTSDGGRGGDIIFIDSSDSNATGGGGIRGNGGDITLSWWSTGGGGIHDAMIDGIDGGGSRYPPGFIFGAIESGGVIVLGYEFLSIIRATFDSGAWFSPQAQEKDVDPDVPGGILNTLLVGSTQANAYGAWGGSDTSVAPAGYGAGGGCSFMYSSNTPYSGGRGGAGGGGGGCNFSNNMSYSSDVSGGTSLVSGGGGGFVNDKGVSSDCQSYGGNGGYPGGGGGACNAHRVGFSNSGFWSGTGANGLFVAYLYSQLD